MGAIMPITRRKMLSAMAQLGGAGAVYETLAAWDFLRPPAAMAASLQLPKDSGRGKTVLILGRASPAYARLTNSIAPATTASSWSHDCALAAAA